ncbi:MAG: hypothetical protein HN855_03905 [Anaerolineae bacterium]|jgi:hypothetical protein|nr:hypothetical protein [Anaerolineae bacterium]MBT7070270.1 hypothetical protein [Anaerolineae bacterium]MBT7324278.1 hypothetical protein [Anaerolineae bacterium]
MKKRSFRIYLGISIFIIFTFGCSIFSSAPMEPAPITQQAPVQEEAAPTAQPALTAIFPTGVVTEKDGTLTLFDREGYTLAQVPTQGLSYPDKSNLHIAGTVPLDGTNLPLIYFSFEQNNSLLFNNHGQVTTLLSVPYFAGMVGAAGKPLIAYSTAEFLGESLVGNLYVGTTQSLPVAEPILSDNDPQGWAVVAIAVDVDGNQVTGVWYSKRPWGIGGDIVFEPRRTLSYLELKTGTAYQYLGAEANPSVLSADREWVAYTNDTSVGAGVGAMTIRNFITGENISYPLLNAIDQRGAGEASFSPSNHYLAWMEASGWQMAEIPNFHSVVRVGNMNGNVIAEFVDTALLSVSGLGTVQRVEPVGWFDDNTLVIMARGELWDDAALISVDIPSNTMSLVAQGTFVGFTYP